MGGSGGLLKASWGVLGPAGGLPRGSGGFLGASMAVLGGSPGGLRGPEHGNIVKYKGLRGVLGPTALSGRVEAF